MTESRLFDARYFPDSIAVTTTRNHSWDYTTDDVGNITSIVETEVCVPMLALVDRTLIGEETFVSCDELSAGPEVTVAAGAEADGAAWVSRPRGRGAARAGVAR